jgi:hypothetical protein
VTKKPDRRGEHEVSRKTIARGMPGESGGPVVTTLVCFFHLHARLRVHWASGIPCALVFLGERFMHNSGASRRGIADAYSTSLRGAKRRSNPLSPLLRLWIASRSLSSGARSRDPLARNDGQDAPHSRPSSPGLTGRPSIPETAAMESKGRSVLDTPLARGMTTVWGTAIRRTINAPSGSDRRYALIFYPTG